MPVAACIHKGNLANIRSQFSPAGLPLAACRWPSQRHPQTPAALLLAAALHSMLLPHSQPAVLLLPGVPQQRPVQPRPPLQLLQPLLLWTRWLWLLTVAWQHPAAAAVAAVLAAERMQPAAAAH